MKCPKCGNEIPEGKLLCEVCGEEVKIVPDFDPEIESQINETLGNIAKSFFEKEKQDSDEEGQEEFELEKRSENLYRHNNFIMLLVIILFLILLVGLGNSFISKKHFQSFDFQYQRAIECSEQNKIQEAIDYLDRALAIDASRVEARLLLARMYEENDQSKSAMKILEEAILIDSDYQADVYDDLLRIYETNQEYKKMGILLKKCPYENIKSKYGRFAANEPVFNVEAGVYDKVQSITMKSETEGIIYYTLDGSTPTKNSMVYEYPIALESGDYTVKAFFVNMYGVESEIVTKTYYISLAKPQAPDISLESGKYDKPQMIEIFHDADTKVYYTLDGSVPTKDSKRYTEPIEMLYGTSNLSVVAITNNNISSDVVRRTYQLDMATNFSPDLAMQVLINQLIMNKTILDEFGHVPNKLGVNQYSIKTVIEDEGKQYFIVSEKYIDTMNKEHNTNNYYAINVYSAELYYARKLKEGKYILNKL